jgi:mediator of replication checkpoint protein 1
MLGLAAEPEESENTNPTSSKKAVEDDDDDDEDEIVAPRPRKLQQRRARSNTPEVDATEPDAAQTPSPRVSRAASRSPGLFVSSPVLPRSPSAHSHADGSDSDPGLPNLKNPRRFKEILARKRQERLAREAEEERKREARLAIQQAEAELMADSGDDSNVTDDEGGRTLTQKSRPSRKASKKALEEMSRETQRMTRSLQLAHEAKTKKKITKASLFERFNFKPESSGLSVPKLSSSSRPASPVSAHHTDAETKDADTPPSSPPAPAKPTDDGKLMAPEANPDSMVLGDDDDDLPTLEATFEAAARQKALDKGKGKATAAELEEQLKEEQPKSVPKVRRNVRVKLPTIHANVVTLGSDDELDIQEPSKGKTKIDAILSRGPINKAKESRPMYMLRRLANLDDPDKKGSAPTGVGKRATKPSITAAELQLSLVQRARAQAKLERDRRLELLKSKGIHIPTEEEREKERAEVEDIVARAREEAEEIMLREREAAKKDRKERKEAGEVDPLAWEDSDASDDDYEEEKEGETKEIELSGSEEEDEEMEDDDENETGSTKDGLIDDAVESGAESEGVEAEVEDAEQVDRSSDDDDEPAALPRQASRRPKKQVVILSDDEESDHHVEATPRPKVTYPKSPSAPNTISPKVPTSVLRSATKTFIPGLPVAGPAGLGLTQIFAGTMDDSQAGPLGASPSQMMPTFDNFPDSQFSQTAQEASADDMVLDSQPTQRATQTQAVETQEGVQLHFSQSQVHGFDSLLRQEDDTQQTDLLEPTQDAGFQEYTPLKQRFVEPPASTIDTVVLSESQRKELHNDSPLVQRAGKLRRRADVLAAARAAESEDEDEASAMVGVEYDEFGFGTTSAFAVMRDAAAREKKLKEKAAFDKKKSKAREMIDEQADESEDEYAGLGGVDGEDSDDESTASVQEMVDDNTKLSESDRAKLKAFYAYVSHRTIYPRHNTDLCLLATANAQATRSKSRSSSRTSRRACCGASGERTTTCRTATTAARPSGA